MVLCLSINPFIYAEDSSNSGNIFLADGTTLEIDSDVFGNVYTSYDGTSVTINGNVTAEQGNAVSADYNSTISVKNNVSIGEGQTVTDTYDDGETYTYYRSNTAVSAWENSSIIVGGNVTTESDQDIAISAYNGSTINVAGSVNGGAVYTHLGENHVSANEADVSRVHISGEGSVLEITEDLITHSDSVGLGVNQGMAQIGGNVENTDGSTLYAHDGASVIIGGDVIAGEGNEITNTSPDGNTQTFYSPSTAIEAYDKSTVTVSGDIVLSNNDTAINANNGSIVEVSGSVNGGNIQVHGDDTQVTVGGGTISNAQVSGNDTSLTGIDNIISVDAISSLGVYDGACAEINGNVSNETGSAVNVWNNATVSIGGNVSSGSKEQEIMLPDGTAQTVYFAGTAINARDQSNVTVEGNVTAADEHSTAISSTNDSTVIVHGNVEGTVTADRTKVIGIDPETGEMTSVDYDGKGGTVTIDGTVTSSGYGNTLRADHESTIEVKDDVISEHTAARAENNSTITIDGDINAGFMGAATFDQGTVTVNGDVNSDEYGIAAVMDSSINVNGDINSGIAAIITDNISHVDVQGNATGGDVGIEIYISPEESELGSITVNGIVNAGEKAISLEIASNIDADAAVSLMPQIIVQTLESEKDLVVVTAPSATSGEKQAIAEALIDNLNYIVNTDEIDQAKIAVYGTEVVDGYVVAKENATITLKSTNDGYIICNVQAGKYATVTENNDGSYSIKVERGGDLNLSADVKKKDDSPSVVDNGSTEWKWPSDWQSSSSVTESVDLSWPAFDPSPLWFEEKPSPVLNDEYFIMPDYQTNILTVNMTRRIDVVLFRNDLETFYRSGIVGVNFITPDSSFYMSMTDLLDLFGNVDQCLVTRNTGALQIFVAGETVLNVELMKNNNDA